MMLHHTTLSPATSSQRLAECKAGRAFARAWRAKNKPIFDAIYGAEICKLCGTPHNAGASQPHEGIA